MPDYDAKLLKIIEEFNRGDSGAIFRAYEVIKGALDLHKYYDPSGARTIDDFESVALLGVWKAIKAYDPSRGTASPSTWVITITKQRLSKELKVITKEQHLPVKYTHYCDFSEEDNDPENTIYQDSKELYPSGTISDESNEYNYYLFVSIVEDRLKARPWTSKMFHIKVIFPNIQRKTMADMLGLSKMNISKHFKVIRTVMESTYEDLS